MRPLSSFWTLVNVSLLLCEKTTKKLLLPGCHLLPIKYQSACVSVEKSVGKFLAHLPETLALEEFTPFSLCAMGEQCLIDCCDNNDAPQQVQLALTGVDTEMSVSWITPASATPAKPCVSLVPASGGSATQQCGQTSTYTHGGWRGTINQVTLQQLAPRTTYNYTVISGTVRAGPFQLVTPPYLDVAAGDPLRFAVIGDMGASNVSDGTVARLVAGASTRNYDVVLHDGDESYSDGTRDATGHA